ncbi:MAG TPA: hypothetical protein VMV18_06175 [bacterium]|nr:hypothetical protein [bacterium]
MKARILTLTLALCGFAIAGSACGNAVDLFGSGHHAKPPDTPPPTWNPDFGPDKYFYYWHIGTDQAGKQTGRIWREKIDLSGTPEEFWKGSPPNYKCVGCHSISKDGHFMNVVELSSRLSIDFSVHTVDLTQSPPQEVIIGTAAHPGASPAPTPPAGSFSSWRPAFNGTSDRFVFGTGNGGLQIASVTSGVLMTLVPVTGDGYQPTMPSWGPDDRIYYAASRYGDSRIVLYEESEIWSVKADGTDKQLVYKDPNGKMAYFPEVSPDGKWLAMTISPGGFDDQNQPQTTFSNVHARVMLLNLENGELVTPDDLDAVTNQGRSWATWSALGNRLTCGTAVPEVDTNGQHTFDSDVYEVSFDSTTGIDFDAHRIDQISTTEFEHIPRWSP